MFITTEAVSDDMDENLQTNRSVEKLTARRQSLKSVGHSSTSQVRGHCSDGFDDHRIMIESVVTVCKARDSGSRKVFLGT